MRKKSDMERGIQNRTEKTLTNSTPRLKIIFLIIGALVLYLDYCIIMFKNGYYQAIFLFGLNDFDFYFKVTKTDFWYWLTSLEVFTKAWITIGIVGALFLLASWFLFYASFYCHYCGGFLFVLKGSQRHVRCICKVSYVITWEEA